MKKSGFTLVELLSVIVILLIIATITVILIGNFTKNSERKTLLLNINEVIKKLELDRSENGITVANSYSINANKVMEIESNRIINLKNISRLSGNIYYNVENKYILLIQNDKYCARKNNTDEAIKLYEIDSSECTIG